MTDTKETDTKETVTKKIDTFNKIHSDFKVFVCNNIGLNKLIHNEENFILKVNDINKVLDELNKQGVDVSSYFSEKIGTQQLSSKSYKNYIFTGNNKINEIGIEKLKYLRENGLYLILKSQSHDVYLPLEVVNPVGAKHASSAASFFAALKKRTSAVANTSAEAKGGSRRGHRSRRFSRGHRRFSRGHRGSRRR